MTVHLKDNNKYLKLFAIEFVVAAIILTASILLFEFIANEIVIENEDNLDVNTFNFFYSYISAFNTKVALVITFFGSWYFLVPANILVIVYLIKKNKQQYSLIAAILSILSFLSGLFIKDIFRRHRPLVPVVAGVDGYSFPSGHSLGAFTFCGVIIFIIFRSTIPGFIKWLLSILILVFTLLIGLSRIYLHVHFASDVLGSLLIAIMWLSLTFITIQLVEKNIKISVRKDL